MTQYKSVGIIGCGVMGQAILSSIVKNNTFNEHGLSAYPEKIYTTSSGPQSMAKVTQVFEENYAERDTPIELVTLTAADNQRVLSECDVIILACKPYMVAEILGSVSPTTSTNNWNCKLFISIVAGWTISSFKNTTKHLGDTKFVRIMTNTPAKFGYGCCVVSYEEETPITTEDKQLVTQLFKNCGSLVELPEKHMDSATSLVGSGPAFVLLMMEGMIDAGIKMGIPYEESKNCALKVMEGTSKMVELTKQHPSVLKHQVCTPGGTTISGLIKMEDKGVKSGIVSGILEAKNVATELGKKK